MTVRAKSALHRILEVALAAGLLWSCDDDPILSERTQVIENNEWPEPRVDGPNLIFPLEVAGEIEKLRPGDVLMSGRGDGLLKLVREVRREGDQVVVITDQAALTDAIVDGDLHSSHRLENSALALRPAELTVGASLENISITNSRDLSARISRGSARFDPTIDVDLRIRSSRVERFAASAGGELEIELAVEIESTRAGAISVELQLLPTVRFRIIHFVGLAPVVEIVNVKLMGSFEIEAEIGASVEIGFRVHGITTAQIVYDGNWSANGDHSVDLTRIGPTLRAHAGFNVRAQVTPRIEIKFYNIAGPFIEADAFVQYRRNLLDRPVSWVIDGGTEGRVGAFFETEFNILGRDIGFSADYSKEIFSAVRRLASGISCTPSGRRCAEGTEYVCAEGGDAENGTRCPSGLCNDDLSCEAQACSPNESRCENGSILTCAADGSAETATACPSGRCRNADACEEQACSPNVSRCSAGVLFACDSSGVSETSSPCPSGQCEDANRCRGQICSPNAARCSGGQLYRCSTDGASETSEPCPSGACSDATSCSGCGGFNEACCVNGPACAGNEPCVGGMCSSCASPCTAGALQCGAGNVEECAADGCTWSVRDRCLSMFPGGADCCADLRTRTEPECVPTTAPMDGGLLWDPVNGLMVEAGNINFSWNPLSWVDRFELRFCSTSDQSICDVPIVVPLGQTNYSVNLAAGTYYWTVRAIRACDFGTWSPWIPQANMLTVY
jgi:hypothetical protein